jgi:tRNA threonylcarbamoyladenosine biosynthesis protein TsaE
MPPMIYMDSALKYFAPDEQSTAKLGAMLGESLLGSMPNEPVIVGLVGPMGAGKTRLVQAVVKAAGLEDAVVASPTFMLVHEYRGQVPIYHFDVYRLKNETEFVAIGPEEYFARPSWSFIEWADRVANFLPPDRLEITIESRDPTTRQFIIRALGPLHQKALAELNRRFS